MRKGGTREMFSGTAVDSKHTRLMAAAASHQTRAARGFCGFVRWLRLQLVVNYAQASWTFFLIGFFSHQNILFDQKL